MSSICNSPLIIISLNTKTKPPESIATLLQRAQALKGLSFAEAAKRASLPIPANLHHQKGWVGQLLETLLGATGGAKAQQDFPQLGVELKTLPLDEKQCPLETTYVCKAPMQHEGIECWENAWLRKKLSCVLWFPMEGARQKPLAERRLGQAFLWRPSAAEEQALQQDWEELTDMILMGHIETISARFGTVLQLRPKAANSKQRCIAHNASGEPTETLPLGFYLRKSFTQGLLQNTPHPPQGGRSTP